MNTRSSLNSFPINTRLVLACLWIADMFLYVYGDYFALYIPGEAGKLVSGDTLLNNPLKVFAASVLMALPPLVIVLSVLARASVARWANIIFGVAFTGIMVLIAVTSMPLTPEVAAYVFYAVIESIVTSIIIWQAWKWPKAA